MKITAALALFCLVPFVFSACVKKTEVDNPSPGSFVFSGVTDGQTIGGSVDVSFKPSATLSIKKYEVFFNDSLIITGNSAPYSFKINTMDFVDGTYKLKGITYDQKDNKTEVSITLQISNPLITLKLDPSLFQDAKIKYVITDNAGNVLQSALYNKSDTLLRLSSALPFKEDRFNVFEMRISSTTYITGYLNIKRGSEWNLKAISPNSNPVISGNNISFSNVPSFSRFTSSSDVFGMTFKSIDEITRISNYAFTPVGKEFVQVVDKNENGYYNFFDIDTAQKAINIDLLNKLHPSIKKSITIAGATDGNFSLYGKADKRYESFYTVDQNFYQGSSFNYYYPDGSYLTDYKSQLTYNKNGFMYVNVYNGLIPENIQMFDATAVVNNKNLSTFNFTTQGNFDYYNINFSNVPAQTYIALYSTSAFKSVKFPDILKYVEMPNLNMDGFKLFSVGLFTNENFDETKLFYKNYKTFPALSVPGKSMEMFFN